jgi:hypothetical protein
MFASILKGKVQKNGGGWAAYWAHHPHQVKQNQQNSQEALQHLHEQHARQAAEDIGHSPIEDSQITHSGNSTKIKTAQSYKLAQGVIDHLASKGFERKEMSRNGTDTIQTMEHPKTKEKIKVGHFNGFSSALTGKGMPSRVEISHVQ